MGVSIIFDIWPLTYDTEAPQHGLTMDNLLAGLSEETVYADLGNTGANENMDDEGDADADGDCEDQLDQLDQDGEGVHSYWNRVNNADSDQGNGNDEDERNRQMPIDNSSQHESGSFHRTLCDNETSTGRVHKKRKRS